MKTFSTKLNLCTIACWLLITSQLISAQDLASFEFKPVQTQEISNQTRLIKVIETLQEGYQISFLYDKKLIRDQKTSVNLDLNSPVEVNLKNIFKKGELTYQKIDSQTYIILKKDTKDGLINMINSLPLQEKNNPESFFAEDKSRLAGGQRQWTGASSRSAEQTITGRVTDSKTNEPIPGVNILVKDTNVGSVTDVDGKYSIVAPDDATVLIFSSIGYVTQEVTINGQSNINVALLSDVTELGEVIITALGIKKESKKVGYATTNVDAKEVIENRSPNFMNALQGKVAGVNISGLGTGPAGTSKIRIRGQSSIAGQNNPLIVINGVPVDNTNFGTNPRNGSPDSSIGVRGGGEIPPMEGMVCQV